MRFLLRILLLVLVLAGAQPLRAAVVITFWSHEQDENFPHAFFALKGTPDAGGEAIDNNYGFTAKTITPAILLGNVAGTVEDSKPGYMRRSDAQFSLVLSDAQLADIQALITQWTHDTRYNLNKRNCVHFVAEAARRAGLTVPDLPKLMKKPTSFLIAVGDANRERVTLIRRKGDVYLREQADMSAATQVSGTAANPIVVAPDH